jgi:ABC-type oligopeptide transport system substrate-binding subunit
MHRTSLRPARLAPFLVLAALIAGFAGVLPAQQPGKAPPMKGPAQKEKGSQKGTPKEEEEEPGRQPRKGPIRVGDEETDTTPLDRPLTEAGGLGEEARRAKNPAVRKLLEALAVPHDVAEFPAGSRVDIDPIPRYVDEETDLKGGLELHSIPTKAVPSKTYPVTRREITRIIPYEQVAIAAVDEFLKSDLDQKPPGSRDYLSRSDMLQQAERALSAVVRFHESALQQSGRVGADWKKVASELGSRLKQVQLDQLRAMGGVGNWEAAAELANRLKEAYPNDRTVRKVILQVLAMHAKDSLRTQDYLEAQRRLLILEAELPGSAEAEELRKQLRKQAEELFGDAQRLEKEGKIQVAMDRAEAASRIDPRLPGLRDFLLRLANRNPTLYVGVRELPEAFSPALAVTDSDKLAVELLFESLVKLTTSPSRGERFEMALAGDVPEPKPLGREFMLVRDAYWSNGQRVTATDVRQTVQLLSDRSRPGFDPLLADLLGEGATVLRDNFHVRLTLHQGVLDPLAVMNFKVLPETIRSAGDPEFAKAPVGSGPYQLGPKEEGGSVTFIANPYYGSRASKRDLPHIRNIRFVHTDDPVREFERGRLHLLLDLPTGRFKQLQSAANVHTETLPNRRIYFLAVNHRQPVLKNQNLRQLLAHAIDREKILNECFREGLANVDHSLNGPYPPGSWACAPERRVAADPYKPNFAKAKAAQVQAVKLTLKYPEGDPAVKKACELIRAQVQAIKPEIHLDLVARSMRDLHREVEETHEYELAYYAIDYPNEMYWLWPYFDPTATGPGGRNFLGYEGDDELASEFERVKTHRQFSFVQEHTHRIHEIVLERLPLIPLWQLDTHIAVSNTLKITGTLDPEQLFADVEHWSLEH